MRQQTATPNLAERPATAHRLPRSARRAVVAMSAGLAVTVLAMLALVFDLASAGVLDRHLHDVYEGYAAPPSLAGVSAYLFTVGALGALGWLWTMWAVWRRKLWARPAATVLFLLGTTVAIANLTVTEYDQTILPVQAGVAGLLPCVAGLVAVVLLWGREP